MYTPSTPQQQADLAAWEEYKRNPSSINRSNLIRRFHGVINNQVNKWIGPVPREVLENEARLLATKAFDTYNPAAGTALSTHITNQLLPLSRLVYKYQNTIRLPENTTQMLSTFKTTNNMLKLTLGREPTTDELHNELGWSAKDITRIRDYNRRDLIESGSAVSSDFFGVDRENEDDLLLGGIYFELSPDEKQLFEAITGYNGARKLSNPEIMQRFGLSQAQLSFKKTKLRNRIEQLMSKQSFVGRR